MNNWYWFGLPKHFIGGHNCRFHMATKVGDWIISTVGDYRPYDNWYNDVGEPITDITRENPELFKRGPQQIGCDRFYETMVFKAVKATCDCCEWSIDVNQEHPDMFDAYNDAKSARDGHMEICNRVDVLNAQ